MEPRTTKGSTVKGSVPKDQCSPGQPAEAVYSRREENLPPAPSSPPPPRKGEVKPWLRVSYLFNKLRGRNKQFLDAAIAGDVPTIKNLLEKGVDIHAQDHSHGTSSALQLAAQHGNEGTVRLLLFEGADVHAEDRDGATALHRAAISGREQLYECC